MICPVCDEGLLSLSTFSDVFKHNAGSVEVRDLECCVCDRCGADPVLTFQIARNQLKISDAKRRALGFLSGEEIKALRKRLGITQREAAERFGGGPNSFSKYERGEVIQSESMDKLLRLMDEYLLLKQEVERLREHSPNPSMQH